MIFYLKNILRKNWGYKMLKMLISDLKRVTLTKDEIAIISFLKNNPGQSYQVKGINKELYLNDYDYTKLCKILKTLSKKGHVKRDKWLQTFWYYYE